ncbi:MAG: LbetaH domain-containing protein, partial [Planctomycetota bacterium]
MADEVIKLQDLSKEDIPADLRAETYFDFNARRFEHQRLLEQTDSVYAAILGIDEYATKWLADTIAKRRSAARAFNNKTPKPAHAIGSFEVLLEEGAVFEPARIIGSPKAGVSYSIYVGKGARIIGTDIYLEKGNIYIGAETTVEPGVGIKGPVIVGKGTEIRQGAYLRGDCIIGNGCVIRGEIKNCVLMDKANFPHPSYLGDSLCGY